MVSSRVCHWLVQFMLISVVGLLLQVVFYEAPSIPEKESWPSSWGPQEENQTFWDFWVATNRHKPVSVESWSGHEIGGEDEPLGSFWHGAVTTLV